MQSFIFGKIGEKKGKIAYIKYIRVRARRFKVLHKIGARLAMLKMWDGGLWFLPQKQGGRPLRLCFLPKVAKNAKKSKKGVDKIRES